MSENTLNFKDTLVEQWSVYQQGFAENLPKVIIAIVILIAGAILSWIVSLTFGFLTKKLSLDKLSDMLFFKKLAKQGISFENVFKRLVPNTLGLLITLLSFLMAANVLEFQPVSDAITALYGALPGVVAGLVVFFVGVKIANFIENMLIDQEGATQDVNALKKAKTLKAIVPNVVVTLAALIGLKQTGLDVEILNYITIAVVGGLGLGIGLGSQGRFKEIADSIFR